MFFIVEQKRMTAVITAMGRSAGSSSVMFFRQNIEEDGIA
jgi:hypothetical protein